MQIDDFFDLVSRRRNISKFKPDPIPDEYILKMLNCARWAQSGANAQSWEFIVVKDQNTKNKIVEINNKHRARSWDIEKTRIRELRHPAYTDGPRERKAGFEVAPVLFIVCGDPRTAQASVLSTHFMHYDGGPGAHFLKNIGNATQILHLAAAALGLASQWISVNQVSEPALKELLDIPEEIAIHTIVPVGYPAVKLPTNYRREVKEFAHFEKYDRSKYRSGEDIYQFLLALRQKTKPSYALKDTP